MPSMSITNGHGSSPVGSQFQARSLAGSEIGVVISTTRPLSIGSSTTAGEPLLNLTGTLADERISSSRQKRQTGNEYHGMVVSGKRLVIGWLPASATSENGWSAAGCGRESFAGRSV